MPKAASRSDARSGLMSAQLGKSLGRPDRGWRPRLAVCSVRPRVAVHKRLEELFWFPEPGILPRDGHIFVVPAKANISTIIKTDHNGLMLAAGKNR